jgi:hypothetical protein
MKTGGVRNSIEQSWSSRLPPRGQRLRIPRESEGTRSVLVRRYRGILDSDEHATFAPLPRRNGSARATKRREVDM